MKEYELHFNYKDIFLAPRLALSPKKIWVLIIGNLSGFILYWIFSYISLILSGVEINDAIADYGLYPFLFGSSAPIISWIIYYLGIFIWLSFILASCAGVSRLTLKQLQGDNFYSANDAIDYVVKKWKSVLFAPFSIFLIILIFVLIACMFAWFGSIPIIGALTYPLLYLFYFFGSIFTIFSFLALISSILFSPAIIGSYEEDTIGTVFLSYQITFSQPLRLILYNILLFPIAIIFINIFSWFYTNSFNLINQIFGFFMGEKLENMVGYASSIVDISWISDNMSDININVEDNSFVLPSAAFDLFEIILGLLSTLFNQFLISLPNFSFDIYAESLSTIDTLAGMLLSVPLILLTLSVLSYGIAIISVGETIIFTIFKKIMDIENILLLNNEIDMDDTIDEIDDLDRSSHSILSSFEEE